MEPREQKVANVTGTLVGERIALGIDPGAMSHIMNILTDLYSDPVLAVIREYSTNARDATIEAGNASRAIEVVTPTPLAPFFRVRDYGVGLSALDIQDIYTRYGASTKRATNAQTGMLGLGCKSALTYTTQFTVVSVKDGARVVVAIGRDEDGTGSATIVDSSPEASENYTEIQIPVKREDISRFERTARDFFRVWEPGTVLLNDRAPDRFEGLDLGGGMWLVQDQEAAAKVVMGGVSYPIALDRFPQVLSPGYTMLAFVGIGDVMMTPNREALRYDDDATVSKIAWLRREFEQRIVAAIQRDIDSQPTKPDALKAKLRWDEAVRYGSARHLINQSYTYKGETVPNNVACPDPGTKNQWGDNIASEFIVASNNTYTRGTSGLHAVRAQDFGGACFVHGFKLQKFTANHRRKLQALIEQRGIEGVRAFYMSAAPVSLNGWVPAERLIAWDDAVVIKLPKAVVQTNGSIRIPGSYDMYVAGNYKHGVEADDIDTSKPLFYNVGGRYDAGYRISMAASLWPDATIVVLHERRVDKFTRNFPSAKLLTTALADAFKAWEATVTDSQRLQLAMSKQRFATILATFKGVQGAIADPDMREAVRLVTEPNPISERAEEWATQGYKLDLSKVQASNPLNRYPLFAALDYGWGRQVDDMVLYMNAKYAADKAAGR